VQTIVLRKLWEGWKRIAHAIGTVQAKLVLSLLYLVVVGPVALVRRLAADPLGLRPAPQPTYWIPRPALDDTLERARRQ
jgi:hypothetical protein